ncbi:RagB/SusD family nutrient uptake outer membrane protein [Maribellus comscasis]|uniref:RagB/SusD family nutrient uptake outer membrane protein n=1 Tax=Maribellus comscasis TaxID=2681766 RepID=A0A6I6K4W9_9BACT|nr:RagB/SusD family nutrient uptake outer membrane protein [Maribellus comscasis]QGY46653.1 RagB/SusD family nutrient uptake outer membrane protein [Maribellus comscasis]
MKKYIIILIIALLFHTSCSDSFFEKYPTDSMTVENYMKDTDEIQTVLNAAYSSMTGTFANSIVYIGDLPTDNAYDFKLNNSSNHIALHESTVDSQNGILSDLWYASYQIINRCCLVIDNMETVTATDEVYNQLVGEAKFLRAYTYYVMVRVWGDVPLVLEDITDYMAVFEYARTPVEQVYTRIIEDLKDAETKLPDFYESNNDKGKASATAAQAILGDVYLTRGDYSNAKTYFEKVIAKEGSNLGLLDNYASIFDANNANNKEIIFAVQYANNQSPSMGNYLGSAALGNIQGIPIDPDGSGSQIYGVNILMMTHELEAKFIEDDNRRTVVYTDLISPDYSCTIPMTLKYFDYQNVTDGISGQPDSGCETIISRYADIILKYAECLNELSNYTEAIGQIRRIRERAGLTTDIDANYESIFSAIEDERQLELCMEGHRWFDLLRTERTKTVVDAFYNRENEVVLPTTISIYQYGDPNSPLSVSDHELLFPLPYDQIELNPDVLIQNPGY